MNKLLQFIKGNKNEIQTYDEYMQASNRLDELLLTSGADDTELEDLENRVSRFEKKHRGKKYGK